MIQIRGRPEKSVYQWETNLMLDFDCIADMFEWETPFLENALPIKPDAETSTKIPDELLQTDAAITVYAKNDGNVVDTFTFGVIARKKPLDYIYTPSEIQSLKDLAERIRLIEESGGLTDEQVKNVVEKYLEENPPEGGSTAKISYVTLLSEAWQGEESPYSQEVEIEGVTVNSQVDLTPNVEQLAVFHNKDLAFVTENDNGIVTVYAIGQKPQNDYTIQVTLTEVIR